MSGRPDPKPVRRRRRDVRVVDPGAGKRVLLAGRACVACHRPSANADHVVPRGRPHLGDDVEENLVPLCGSGSSGCHGAKHGSPYVDAAGVRWESLDVRREIGEWIARRPATIAYVLGKLGDGPGRDYLLRVYLLDLEPAR